jgi:CelD/BcsL family acetyltransferase involved in cellulose biosynthesis
VTIYSFNPLQDSRWAQFVETHKGSSIFHTTGWLLALRLTYGYEPVVFTTSPDGATLTNGIVFCHISSWLTGRRLVSLPFADHCEPLLENAGGAEEILGFLRRSMKAENWKYIELRPLSGGALPQLSSLEKGSSFAFHMLDLRPKLDTLFNQLQKSSIQRMIRRAEGEGVCSEQGHSEPLLAKFYRLMLKTRRRHKLPPQPVSWFRNLIECLGDRLDIRVALKDGRPVASILTLTHKSTLVYKYGCSDARYHSSGAMPFLLWDAVRAAKERGLREFDLGRSDSDNSGLITFKNRWGASASMLEYVRFSSCPENAGEKRGMHVAQRLFSCMPDGLLTAAGKLLYRHIG